MAVSVTASRYTLYNNARFLCCAREGFSLHCHIEVDSGVYALFYITTPKDRHEN